MGAGRKRVRKRFDLLTRIEGQRCRIRLTSPVGVLGWIGPERVGARPHAVVEDCGDQLPGLVHRSGGGAGGSDRPKEVFDLTGRDLASRAIAQGGHDQTGGGAAAPAVGLPGLGEQASVVPQRRGLGALSSSSQRRYSAASSRKLTPRRRRPSASRSSRVCSASCSRTSASIRSAASASVRAPTGERPRLRRQPPFPSESTQARPSARITG